MQARRVSALFRLPFALRPSPFALRPLTFALRPLLFAPCPLLLTSQLVSAPTPRVYAASLFSGDGRGRGQPGVVLQSDTWDSNSLRSPHRQFAGSVYRTSDR